MKLNKFGGVVVRCNGCDGALSTFEWRINEQKLGSFQQEEEVRESLQRTVDSKHWRLFRCSGCGTGGLGLIYTRSVHAPYRYPQSDDQIVHFYPVAGERRPLPDAVPDAIVREYREAETCVDAGALRAASGMFRSVLEKALVAAGFRQGNLRKKIDAAASDHVITEPRKEKAHQDVRVLGNDVFHEEWREVTEDEVAGAHHYTQRILEDLYDDRDSVLARVRHARRTPEEDKTANDGPGSGEDENPGAL